MRGRSINESYYCSTCDRHFTDGTAGNDHADRNQHKVTLTFNWKTSSAPLKDLVKPFLIVHEKGPSDS
jgi:hypothetical protein